MAGFLRINSTLPFFFPTERLFLIAARYKRGITLGVRAVVFDPAGRVLLVKHGYSPGWHFPGGGVEPRETAEQAAARELEEETGIHAEGRPEFFGLYLNRIYGQRDHVAVFLCKNWRKVREPRVPNFEIAAVEFFAPDALPQDATPATRRRLAEIAGGGEKSPDW